MNVKLVSLLSIALVLMGGIILLLHYLEEKQPPNEFTKISELMNNPENFENENVRIKGKLIDVYGGFEVEDNTGKISVSYSGEGLAYDVGENVVVTVSLGYNPVSSIWPGFHMINIENAGEKQPSGIVEIDKVLENLEKHLENMEPFGIRVTIKGTMASLGTNCHVWDNTGEIYCYSSESFPFRPGEKVVIEGKFVIYRNPLGNLYPRIRMQKVERAG